MPKTEIDSEVLATLANTLAQAAGLLQQAITVPVPPERKEPKRRGRPKKTQPEVAGLITTNTSPDIMEALQIEAPLPEERKANPNIVAAKRVNHAGFGVREHRETEKVVKKQGEQKFVDLAEVGDRIPSYKYPTPSERRPPAQQFDFTCARCHRPFKGYFQEYEQAFMEQKIDNVKGKSLVKCKDCETLPV